MTEAKTKRKAAAEPLTIEQIAERRVREKLEEYRALVARVADGGDHLTEADVDDAYGLLDSLGLPPYAFERDVRAWRDHDSVVKAESAARAQRPANEARLTELNDQLKRLEAEVASLKAEQHRLGSMADHTLGFYMTRRQELESGHVHLLSPLEDAVRFRLEQQQQQRRRFQTVGAGVER